MKLKLNRTTVRNLTSAPVSRVTGYCPTPTYGETPCDTSNCATVASIFASCDTFPVTTVQN